MVARYGDVGQGFKRALFVIATLFNEHLRDEILNIATAILAW